MVGKKTPTNLSTYHENRQRDVKNIPKNHKWSNVATRILFKVEFKVQYRRCRKNVVIWVLGNFSWLKLFILYNSISFPLLHDKSPQTEQIKTIYISVSVGQEYDMKMSFGLCSHLEMTLERNLLPRLLRLLKEFEFLVAVGLRVSASWISAGSFSQFLEATYILTGHCNYKGKFKIPPMPWKSTNS